ncbi:tripartite tricarboxylate transporter substrate binding protein [Parapusillimonas granuli]|uniref:Tripartite tricarboxylate transporter substrate binding protein n=1 Tax=Parapusillimonas granuli TaxID=380911 RepID=A0A853G9T6_9BURK|nr:tripartite tricarboxylate transporter substrate binding protein [Parapusillimonas granuli]MBB5216439.1 tripartite-type tricarboxylate transporter receptor subunit TctC [Parapusillimonas granuli]NYT51506.1 tripartite tricarboxylate transporter substrate binding protein [Parapusillimonas granuli]
MKMKWLAAAMLAAGAQLVSSAHAQGSYPGKSIKILVPFSPGSLVDTIARLYSDKLSERLGQPVVVENKVGSGGIIATRTLLQAPADGYTLQMVSSSHAINATLYKDLPYDTANDLSCVGLVASSPTVISISPSLKITSVKDFVEHVKKRPGKMNYGSGGIGTAAHLAGEYFVSRTGTEMVHVPYKGVQEAVMEIIGGRIDLAFPPVSIAMPQMQAGKLTGLAVTGAERSPLLPDTPTAQEAGLEGFEYQIWYALLAPKRTPEPVMQRLATELKAVSALPEIREKLVAQGITPRDPVLGECDDYIKAQIAEQGELVKASGATAK